MRAFKAEALASAAELRMVSKYTKRNRLSLVPTLIFERLVHQAIFKATRPPTKKHLGTKLREPTPVPTLSAVFFELTSTQRGLPVESPTEELTRCSLPGRPQQKAGQPLLAVKETYL